MSFLDKKPVAYAIATVALAGSLFIGYNKYEIGQLEDRYKTEAMSQTGTFYLTDEDNKRGEASFLIIKDEAGYLKPDAVEAICEINARAYSKHGAAVVVYIDSVTPEGAFESVAEEADRQFTMLGLSERDMLVYVAFEAGQFYIAPGYDLPYDISYDEWCDFEDEMEKCCRSGSKLNSCIEDLMDEIEDVL